MGQIPNGKQNHRCCQCGRQFVEQPKNKVISQETKKLIDKLLQKKSPSQALPELQEPLSLGRQTM